MNGNEIPQQWVKTTLGHIVDYGRSAKKTLVDVNDNTWVLELEDIEKDSSKLLSKVKASDRKFKSTKNTFHQGDVLYGKLRPYLNKVIMADEDGVCTTEIIPINAEPFCINRYIFFWLKNPIFLRYVREVSYGVNMPRLGTNDGKSAPFYLAPLAEQKIIADKLDDLLARVESIKIRLENIPEILKKFRQSVLSAAVNGKLTEKWRKENESPFDLWKSGILNDFIQKPSYGSSSKSQSEGEIPVLRMGNLQRGEIDWTDLVYTSDPKEIEKYTLASGDVLFNRTNSPELVGKTSIYRGERNAIYAGYLIRVKVKDSLNSDFLNYHLNSPQAKEYCLSVKSDGVSQSNINAKKLSEYPISVPPYSEQIAIINKLENFFYYIDNIERKSTNTILYINNLTQSILAKAFRGELTAQWREENPELISGINSAEALLEKITAEKLAAGTIKKRAKKTSH
ncbi:TPA: restriction endonuclease subunit S [Klebsiella pneumoniae]